MKSIFKKILLNREQNKKMFALLLDPDQCRGKVLSSTIAILKVHNPDFVFVGGSHTHSSTEAFVEVLKEETKATVVLFPGNAMQFTAKANALLYLSLLSGRNPEYLIGQHIGSSLAIKKSGMEVIPTGYILVDGGKTSATEYISNTRPIPAHKKEIVLSTAVAGELLGMKMIYLEAGSGATEPVEPSLIQYVKESLAIPIIVGGGITSTEKMKLAFVAGADIVVVGNIFETHPERIESFVQFTREYNDLDQLI
jgi:phosphoglycerol geranylgeranyltransferase